MMMMMLIYYIYYPGPTAMCETYSNNVYRKHPSHSQKTLCTTVYTMLWIFVFNNSLRKYLASLHFIFQLFQRMCKACAWYSIKKFLRTKENILNGYECFYRCAAVDRRTKIIWSINTLRANFIEIGSPYVVLNYKYDVKYN